MLQGAAVQQAEAGSRSAMPSWEKTIFGTGKWFFHVIQLLKLAGGLSESTQVPDLVCKAQSFGDWEHKVEA